MTVQYILKVHTTGSYYLYQVHVLVVLNCEHAVDEQVKAARGSNEAFN